VWKPWKTGFAAVGASKTHGEKLRKKGDSSIAFPTEGLSTGQKIPQPSKYSIKGLGFPAALWGFGTGKNPENNQGGRTVEGLFSTLSTAVEKGPMEKAKAQRKGKGGNFPQGLPRNFRVFP
jgi:hypothetical protein